MCRVGGRERPGACPRPGDRAGATILRRMPRSVRPPPEGRSADRVLGDLVLDVVAHACPAAGARNGRAGSGGAAPGRLRRERGPLVRPARCAFDARRRPSVATRSGRTLVDVLRSDGVTVRATRVGGRRDRPDRRRRRVRRGAIVRRRPRCRRPAPARGSQVGLVRRRTCSTCRPTRCSASPLGQAGRRAIELARERGAIVSLDLASIGAAPGAWPAGPLAGSSRMRRRTCCSRPRRRPRPYLGGYDVERAPRRRRRSRS